MESEKNYYPDFRPDSDGMKYRLGGEDVIRRVCDKLGGITRDKHGRVESSKPEMALMNEQGVYNAEFVLEGMINKVTHLTKYDNKDEVNRQIQAVAKMWAFELALNRKKWGVVDKDIVQQIVENTIQQAMRRAVAGFENVNISRNWQVSQIIDQRQKPPNEKKGMSSSLDTWGGQ